MADFVVLASGSGSNFQAIARHVAGSDHRLLALISDRPEAYALVRAEELRVPSIVVNYGVGRKAAEARLKNVLLELEPDLVVLAGFMKVLPADIVDLFPQRILNIHPSILPHYAGLHAIERSFADPDAAMGITIHYVDRGVDTGPIVAQFQAERREDATVADMEDHIHALEHTHYPEIIEQVLDTIASEHAERVGAHR